MLNAIEKRQLANYERQMALPKWKYILIYGVLAWGLTVGILVSVVTMLLNKVSFEQMFQRDLWFNLIGFPIGGIFFGLFMRNFIPRQIKRLREKELQP
jgi:NADH:ubiquinone oxidoreductase subunit 6 (subunit J)